MRLPASFVPLLVASALFGASIVFTSGAFSYDALALIVVALGILVFCFVEQARGPKEMTGETTDSRGAVVFLWITLFAMLFSAWSNDIIVYLARPWVIGRAAQVGLLVVLCAYAPFVPDRPWIRLLRFAAFALCVVIAGVDVIRSSPTPKIDVWTVQQAGAAALAAGKNAYTAVAVGDTGPRIANDVPYVYPPTQIYLTLPAWLLGRDVRYTMLTALVVAGCAMRFITSRREPRLPALAEDAPALFVWSMPKMFFILEQSWVDPVQLMLISLVLAAYVAKRPILTAVLLGVVLSAKQTMFWAAGLIGFLVRFNLRQWLIAGAVGAAMVLPFAVADFGALKHANLDFLSHLPPRPDALTFNSWAMRKLGFELPGAAGFVLAAVVAGLAACRLRGSVGRAALAVATTYAFFFSFNKWAFANYYFLLAGLTALAAAASTREVEVDR